MEASVHSFHDDVHFNIEGVEIVGRLVAEMLVEQVIPVKIGWNFRLPSFSDRWYVAPSNAGGISDGRTSQGLHKR